MNDKDDFIKSLVRIISMNIVDGKEIRYNNTLHIMEEKSELQTPSEFEIYKFNKKAWSIKNDEDYIYLMKKRS